MGGVVKIRGNKSETVSRINLNISNEFYLHVDNVKSNIYLFRIECN